MDTRVAAYAVITDPNSQILLARWHRGARPTWTLPGGGLEPGEDPMDAVHREVEEETGFTIVVHELLGVNSAVIPASARTHSTQTPLHAIRIIYRAQVISGQLRYEVGGSTDRAEWFSQSQVSDLHRVKFVDSAIEMIADSAFRPTE